MLCFLVDSLTKIVAGPSFEHWLNENPILVGARMGIFSLPRLNANAVGRGKLILLIENQTLFCATCIPKNCR